MSEYTADEIGAFAQQRNVETGRRTDFLSWLHVRGLIGGSNVIVGVRTRSARIVASAVGTWQKATRQPGTAAEAVGVTILGPVLVEGCHVDIIYGKPLAFGLNFGNDRGVLFLKRIAGKADTHHLKLNHVAVIACSPSEPEIEQRGDLIDLPLRVCPGDRVCGVHAHLNGLVEGGIAAIELLVETTDGEQFRVVEGLDMFNLAKRWETTGGESTEAPESSSF